MSEEIPTNVKVIKGTYTKKRHEMQRENSDGIDGVLKFNVGNSSMYEIRTQLSFQKDCESAFICKQTFMLVAKTLWPFIWLCDAISNVEGLPLPIWKVKIQQITERRRIGFLPEKKKYLLGKKWWRNVGIYRLVLCQLTLWSLVFSALTITTSFCPKRSWGQQLEAYLKPLAIILFQSRGIKIPILAEKNVSRNNECSLLLNLKTDSTYEMGHPKILIDNSNYGVLCYLHLWSKGLASLR